MLPPPTGSEVARVGRIAGSTPLRYPSPFLDVASTYYPRTIRELLELCQVYFHINPLLAATINKLARYSVTDPVVVHKSKAVRDRWSRFLREDLHFRSFQISANVEYYALGNCLVSIIFPFIRQLSCTKCGHTVAAKSNQDLWDYRGNEFVLSCPKCNHTGGSKVTDVAVKSPSQIKLHRWPALDIVIEDGDYPGTERYLYKIPPRMANQIRLGRKNVVSVVPIEFLEAVHQNRMAVLNPANLWHLKRPALAGKHRGWGLPLIASVLKYVFFIQIMMKSMEVILCEFLVPLRILFPQAAGATSDPYTNVWLADWKRQVETEIKRWKRDSAYIPIVPLPIGAQTIGGEGRSLLLSQEIRMWLEQVVAALEVPLSFMFSSGSYAGDMVALRQLENLVLPNVEDQRDLLKWVIQSVSAYMGWEPPESVHFKPFKTADYLQRQQFLFALANAGMISKHTLLADNDLDYEDEMDLMAAEVDREAALVKSRARMNADAQSEAAVIMANAQVRARAAQAQKQKALMQGPMSGSTPPGGIGGPQYTEQPPELPDVLPQSSLAASSPLLEESNEGIRLRGGVNVSAFHLAAEIARRLSALPDNERRGYLDQLKAEQPHLYGLVIERLTGPARGHALPEQRAPEPFTSGI